MRRIIEVSEVIKEEEKIRLNQLYAYNYHKEKLEKRNESLRVREKIKNCFRMNERRVKKEEKKRMKALNGMGKEFSLQKFFDFVNCHDSKQE